MIIDTSAVMAIVRREPSSGGAVAALRSARRADEHRLMSAATLVELGVVVDGKHDPLLERRVTELLDLQGVDIVAFDAQQAAVARQAYRDFGRGSGHPARLNLGDCFSYALASVRREPLLYVGNDFSHTDLRSVL